jgi:hypothetical protein
MLIIVFLKNRILRYYLIFFKVTGSERKIWLLLIAIFEKDFNQYENGHPLSGGHFRICRDF